MSSAINTNSINANYPIPGVNNSSQGFRDNFSSIKTNLNTAGSEITELQNKVLLKSPLTGTTLNNDMANALISNALVSNFRHTTYNLGNSLSGVVTIDVTRGDVQYGTLTGSIILEFTKWSPTSTYNSVELVLTIPSPVSGSTISIPSNVDDSKLLIENYSGGYITAPNGQYELRFIISTYDCGTNLSIQPVNRSHRSTQVVTSVPATNVGARGDRAGTMAADSNYLYICTGTYDGSTAIWKRIALSAW